MKNEVSSPLKSELNMVKVKRKTFAAREDFLNHLGKIAERKGLTLYNTVNDIFQLFINAEQLGVNLEKTVEQQELLENARTSGFILVPEIIWYDLIDEAYRNQKKQTLQKWFQAGQWIAKRYRSSDFKDPFEAFKVNMQSFTWKVSEFTLQRDEETGILNFRLVGPRLSESYVALFTALMKGALQEFGYRIVGSDVSFGDAWIRAKEMET